MYGVPTDLPIQRFVGDFLFSVSITAGGIHFQFNRAGTISVERRWELKDSSGQLVDRDTDNGSRDAYRVHVILNEHVARYRIEAPSSFTLAFESGHELTIYDDSTRYESFHIYPDEIHV
jgi:hypothetical protein